MTTTTRLLLGALHILCCCYHATAEITTVIPPSHTYSTDRSIDPDTAETQTIPLGPASTSLTNVQPAQLAPESAGLEWGDAPTTSRILITRTMMLTSTIAGKPPSETASSNSTAPLLPVEAVSESTTLQNTTTTQSLSTRSSTSTNTLTSTIYVLQPTSSASQTVGVEATESASWLDKSGVSNPGSSANIAAIGLGAGFGAILLVVVSIMAMWLFHRRTSSKDVYREEDGKLERQSEDR